MPLPLKYNVRHVARRWKTTSMTILAIALVVAIFICMLALSNGITHAFRISGEPRNVIVLRSGSNAETNSAVERTVYDIAKVLPGIARDKDGNALVTAETINIATLPKKTGGGGNASIRGFGPMSMAMRPQIKLVAGRMPDPALHELIVGSGAAERFANTEIGDEIKLVKSKWKIVGRFEAENSAFSSELWGDVDRLNLEFDRTVYSSLLMQADSIEARDALIKAFKDDQRLSKLEGQPEAGYYEKQTAQTAKPIEFLGMLISIIMAIGAVFAAMNAMYASISSRAWEISTLRVIGFSRFSIILSFCLESLFVGFIGGVIGALLALPINGVTTGTTSWSTFSELAFAFRITPSLVLGGIVFASLIGVIGGFLPAIQASRIAIVDGLKGEG
ncbi:ABC transporter permease [Candidatus Sumerlaeota bacterium]|nr:ABC transporter permease [Candidatus Sumerlaeota bacterium]